MAIAPVLKTGVRKDLGVRIPRPPLELAPRHLGERRFLDTFLDTNHPSEVPDSLKSTRHRCGI
jgi:hypothetical protein